MRVSASDPLALAPTTSSTSGGCDMKNRIGAITVMLGLFASAARGHADLDGDGPSVERRPRRAVAEDSPAGPLRPAPAAAPAKTDEPAKNDDGKKTVVLNTYSKVWVSGDDKGPDRLGKLTGAGTMD